MAFYCRRNCFKCYIFDHELFLSPLGVQGDQREHFLASGRKSPSLRQLLLDNIYKVSFETGFHREFGIFHMFYSDID